MCIRDRSEVVSIASAHAHISGVKQVKFHTPLKPGQEYVISFSTTATQTLKFAIHYEQTLIANGLLQLQGAEHG